jgi:hypothetical protein
MRAHTIVAKLLESSAVAAPDVVMVYEQGTSDPFTALYINQKLVVNSPRGDVGAVLDALGITPVTVFIPRGFEGNFPDQLSDLKDQIIG